MLRKTITVAAVVICIIVGPTCASVPPMINYQGKLMQPSGVPVPDGNYSMQFAVYAQEIGGTALWSETNPSVQVKGGLFSVLLGSTVNLPGNLFDSADRWFGVTVGADPEMSPRQQIASAPFAFRAATAGTVDDGAITADKLADASVISDKIADGAVVPAKTNGALPVLIHRQGGSATDWSSPGTTSYAVTDAVIQCGATNATKATYVTVTFPSPFAQTPVVTCQLMNSFISSYAILITAVSTTQFTFYNSNANNDCVVLWTAMGK